MRRLRRISELALGHRDGLEFGGVCGLRCCNFVLPGVFLGFWFGGDRPVFVNFRFNNRDGDGGD